MSTIKSVKGDVIEKYIVRDSMIIYPSQSITVFFVKYNSTGSEVDSVNL